MSKIQKIAILMVIMFTILSNGILSAQKSNNATLSGLIIDKTDGSPLIGARLMLKDAKKGANTRVGGSFTVKEIEPGEYTLVVSYVGYVTQEITNVEFKPNESKVLNIALESASITSEEVVVTAARVYDTEAAMLSQRKNASQVSDGLSKQEMDRLPDGDAGQALKRVSGVTLVDNKFVYVRGVSERYNNTTLNGTGLTSTEPDKKSFSFDMFPSEFLETINIVKSFTPDLPGNFVGGLVEMNTISFPERPMIKFSTSAGYADNITLQNAKFRSYQGGAGMWSADVASLRLPSDFPTNTEFRGLIDEARNSNNTAAREQWADLSRSLGETQWKQDNISALPNTSFGISFADVANFDNDDRMGIVGAINYGNNFRFNDMTRAVSHGSGDGFLIATEGTQSSREINMGGMLNLAYSIGNHSTISLKNSYSHIIDDNYIELEGFNAPQGFDILQRSWHLVQRDVFSTLLVGEHSLGQNFLNNATMDWRVGYSRSNRDEPDFRRSLYVRDIESPEDDPYRAQISNTRAGSGPSAGRFFSELDENMYNANFNMTIPMDNLKIKFGGLAEIKDRAFDARSFTFIQGRAVMGGGFRGIDVFQDPGDLFINDNIKTDGIMLSEETKLSDAYSATEETFSAYLMGDYSIGDFRFIVGARIENNVQSLDSYSTVDGEPVNVNRDLTDLLPSLNVVYKYDENTNFRFSASQTLARPTFREFAPFAFFDFQNQMVARGNPNMKRSLIQNVDFRFEHFPRIGEVMSATVFYKRFENAIEETIIAFASELGRTYTNANGIAHNLGLELEFRSSLDFIHDALSDFAINTNVTIVNSELEVQQANVTDVRPMWGQSPYSVNVGMYYSNPVSRTAVNVGYNIVGRKIVQVAQVGAFDFEASGLSPHVFEMPRDVIDFSISQPIGNSLQIKFAGRDILNQPLEWIQGNQVVASNIRGRQFTFGLSYDF